MRIEADFDYSVIAEMGKIEAKYGQKCVDRATADALKAGKTELSTQIREVYEMKKKDIDSYIEKEKDALHVESRTLTIGNDTHFKNTPKSYKSQKDIAVSKRKRVTVTVKKGNKEKMNHAFIANPDKIGRAMVWQRKDSKHIEPVKSLSAAQMASNEVIAKKTMDTMEKTMEKRLEHYAEREAKRIANH